MYFIKYCQCGGDVEIITFRDEGKSIVDYGICKECLEKMTLPPEESQKFYRENKSIISLS